MVCTVKQLRARTADPGKQPDDRRVQLGASLLIVPVEPLIDHQSPPEE
jgi:hypothetical protein